MTLIFDTETTGKADFNLPATAPQQPRIVQIGAILFDDNWIVRQELNLIIKPDGWKIEPEAVAVHKITNEIANLTGIPEKVAIGCFSHLLSLSKVLVAHNIKFDSILIEGCYARHGQSFPAIERFCTMEAMTPVCKIPKGLGYKWPRLEEAYKHTFNETFDDAHDAMADVRACARIYKWLKEGKPKTQSQVPLDQISSLPSESKQADGQARTYEPSFNDDDIMPFGKYKGERLQDVDADYLSWLWHNGCSNIKIKNYIWNSRNAINKELRRNEPIKTYK